MDVYYFLPFFQYFIIRNRNKDIYGTQHPIVLANIVVVI